ncbi:HAD family hydrolase [Paractinoplanes atraurantiacus]|uniref:Putative hydrolase of the HAD superfamily n=1 Tax=Paractinoplanes atraurantiacus TaxID=1036182 RepID=A0A285JY90_9ACTN|nr:HAD family phosphatase [Actinoplanes atraurantiacus]SNY64727.1 putative hydrolase of the HAD superfamily [Actinoplanes atraurantiacus]
MPEVVLFDLFGVIARNQAPEAVHALTEIAGAAAPAFLDAYWRHRPPYDRGQCTATAYWQRVALDLGTTFDTSRIANLIAADTDSWGAVDDDMVTLIERAAASGVRLALLSNIPEELAAHYEQHHRRWMRHFELVAFSCRIGRAKPDPEAFRWCARELGADPGHILFIDDRAENIAVAGRLGMRTHLFTGPARLKGVTT